MNEKKLTEYLLWVLKESEVGGNEPADGKIDLTAFKKGQASMARTILYFISKKYLD